MRQIGLTGGIGAGKSTVARLLADQGAVVIDADTLARELVAPGTPGLAEVLAEFGPQVRDPAGALDRAALARIVFADPQARRRLEDLLHPRVAQETARRLARLPADAVVVHEVPLLAERGLADRYDAVLVVEAPLPLRLERLRGRGMSTAEALARIRAQAGEEERRAVATVVISNDGPLPVLADRVARAWAQLRLPAR